MKLQDRYFIPALIGASFLLRAAYAVYTGNTLIYPDEKAYHDLALRAAASADWGGLFHGREPLYPLLVWLTYKVTGPVPLAVKLLQAALSAASAWLLFRTAAPLFGRGAARLALLIFAFYPFSVFYDARLLRESLLLFLGLAALHYSLRPASVRSVAAASALAGLAAMAKSIFLFFWLPFIIFGLLLRKVRPAAAAAGAAAFAIAVSPLLLYNWHHTGSAFLTRGQMVNLYTTLVVPMEVHGVPGEKQLLERDPAYKEGMALPEAERDAFFKAKLIEEVKERPLNFARFTLWRFAKLWRLYPYRGLDYAAGAWALLAAVSLLSDGWLVPLGAWAAIRLRRRFGELYPAYVYLLSFTLIYSLSWSQMRYRLPLMPVMMLLASPLLAKAAGKAGLDFFKENAADA